MCGIFGIIVKENSGRSETFIKNGLQNLAEVSIARGQDSSGIVFKNNDKNEFSLVKGDIPITKLLKDNAFLQKLNEALSLCKGGQCFQAMGHARLVTNGSQLIEENNQPVVKDGIIGIHNGIIVNADKLWQENTDLKREYEIDTEILLSLIRKELSSGNNLPSAIAKTLNKTEGTVSSALLFDDRNEIALFTNNGSLYYILENDFLLFASEEYFLKQVMKKFSLQSPIKQVKAFEGFVLNVNSFESTTFNQKETFCSSYAPTLHNKCNLKSINLKGNLDKEVVIDPKEFTILSKEHHLYKLLEFNSNSINKLKRCTKCILPETFPFIEFDEKGECNYCKNYKSKLRIEN